MAGCCRGVPLDFKVAAEFFKKASDSNDADVATNFGCCLERSEGVGEDIKHTVLYS
jgi:TPR repeat protein